MKTLCHAVDGFHVYFGTASQYMNTTAYSFWRRNLPEEANFRQEGVEPLDMFSSGTFEDGAQVLVALTERKQFTVAPSIVLDKESKHRIYNPREADIENIEIISGWDHRHRSVRGHGGRLHLIQYDF